MANETDKTREDDRAMTVADVAKFLDTCTRTVERLISTGELESFRVGKARRVMLSDLREFIRRQKKAG